MRARLLLMMAAVLVAAAGLTGCGGKSSTAPPPPTQGGARNEVEPNDFIAQSLGALGANDFVVSGAISSGDVDLYSVSSSATFALYASVDWNTSSDDLELAISNSNGVFVRHVNTAGHPEACTIAGLPAGTYTVRVDALGSAATSYQLTIGTR